MLGVFNRTGGLIYLRPALTIDDAFVRSVASDRALNEHYRFAEPCLQHDCGNWSDGRCHVAAGLVARDAEPNHPPGTGQELAPCPIRSDCRWFAQEGIQACRRCPEVISPLAGEAPAAKETSMPTTARKKTARKTTKKPPLVLTYTITSRKDLSSLKRADIMKLRKKVYADLAKRFASLERIVPEQKKTIHQWFGVKIGSFSLGIEMDASTE